MTTKIFAEDLKQWDKIFIPASSQTNEKVIRVWVKPVLNDLTVNFSGFKVKKGQATGKQTPFQFGRKVELQIERPDGKILKENSTHKAVLEPGGKIKIYIKGFEIDDMKYDDEYLYSIPVEDEDDLFAIFERYDEDNRINVAEANVEFGNR